MTRLICVLAVTGVLPVAQPDAQRAPLIRWQPTNGPLGGEADSILVHSGQLVVPVHNVGAWRSRDRGKSWQLVREREDSWGMTRAGSDTRVGEALQHPREDGLVCLEIDQATRAGIVE